MEGNETEDWDRFGLRGGDGYTMQAERWRRKAGTGLG